MRKLAREAVIFMLLTPIVVFVGSFAYLYHDAHKLGSLDPLDALGGIPARPLANIPPPPAGYTLDQPAASKSTSIPPPQANHVKSGRDIDLSAGLIPKSKSNAPHTAPAFDPNAAYAPSAQPAPDPYAGILQPLPSSPQGATPVEGTNTPVPELLGNSLLLGLYGFPTGLGLWVFYRFIRFAIKG